MKKANPCEIQSLGDICRALSRNIPVPSKQRREALSPAGSDTTLHI